jgi:hypothetical protein
MLSLKGKCTTTLRRRTHGLLSLVVSDAIWAELPNNTTIINGVATTIDRNSFPPPAQPAGTVDDCSVVGKFCLDSIGNHQ